ncbi:DUF1919 domain-containing protein [Limosilactobacillus reuteri]|uniref:DUF1919 domain-containing protein n=1 Tax=Limosilactobacillus reuteri TaxID=1598 RepID=UPI003CFF80C8
MKIITRLRQLRLRKKLQKQLNNKDFTIISSTCVGGKIYHDLGLKFTSPTINLWIGANDFLKFVKNLKYYLESCDLREVKDTNEGHPVGALGEGNERIIIHFTHYPNFQIAKEKWNLRKKRVNYDKIYIFFTDMNGGDSVDIVKEFNKLPYKNKVMFTGKDLSSYSNTFFIKRCCRDGHLGEWWNVDKKTGYYFYQQFDYVKFLNQTVEE